MNTAKTKFAKVLKLNKVIVFFGLLALLLTFLVFFILKNRIDNQYTGEKVVNLKIVDSLQGKYKVGDKFEVALFLDNNVKQNTMEAVIHFDQNTLEMESIKEVAYNQENLVIGKMIENEEGTARFDMASTAEFFETNKPLITFTFKVKATNVTTNSRIYVSEQTTLGYPNTLKKEDLGGITVEFSAD